VTDQRRPEAPLEALPALRHVPHVEEFERSMTGARQTIAVIITFRNRNKNSIERRTGDDRSSSEKNVYVQRERFPSLRTHTYARHGSILWRLGGGR
jgi:hypothetical protein